MTPTLRLLALVGPHARRLALAAGAAVASQAAAVALTTTAGWMVARAADRPEIGALAVAIVAVRGLALGRGLLRYADRLIGHDAVLRATAALRVRVFDALRPLAPAGTPVFRSGDLVARLVDDVDAVQDLVLRVLVPAIVALVVGAGAVAVCATVLPVAGLVLAAGLVLGGAVVPALVYRGARGDEADTRAELATRAVDLARGADDLRVFGATDDHRRAAAAVVRRWTAQRRRSARRTGRASVAVLVGCGLTVLAVALLARTDGVGTVDVVVVGLLALATLDVLAPLPDAASRLVDVRARTRRLAELWDTPAPVVEPSPSAARAPETPTGLRIRGLTARYPGADRPVLDGIDLTLAPGERVALSGASGTGKSTLVAVLMRFLDPERGEILLGGRDLRAIPGDTARATVGGVTRDAHVFRASVRDNLRLADPDATDDTLVTVLARVRLGPWLDGLPDGLGTELASGGTTVSGGQRVRLLLARALLADPAILVLDEPTDGLDGETAAAVLRELLDATRDRAVLLITHDPVDAGLVDRSVVLGEA